MKKKPSDFPFAKPSTIERKRGGAFITWLVTTFQLHITMLSDQPKMTVGFRASNGNFIGFAHERTTDLVYLQHPFSTATAISLNNSAVTAAWRRKEITDEAFANHRTYYYHLSYRLFFWRHSLPTVLDRLGCASDIRLVARLTLALNYTIPPINETPASDPCQPDLPFF